MTFGSEREPGTTQEIREDGDPGPRNMSSQGGAVRTLGREAKRRADISTSPNRQLPTDPLDRMREELRAVLQPAAWSLLDRLGPAAIVRLHAKLAQG